MPPHFQQPPSPSGPPSGSKRRRAAVVAGCVAAAVAVLAAGTLAFLNLTGEEQSTGADGNSPAKASPAADRTQSRQLLKVLAPKQSIEDSQDADGSWVTSRSYASGAFFAVHGYDLDSGKQTWSVPLDGNLCGASRAVTSKGFVAVVFAGSKKAYSKCTEVAVIDINQGRKVWQKSVPEATLGLDLSVAVSENFAAVGWSGDESWGFAVDTGKTVWNSPPTGCGYEEYLGVRTLTGIAFCSGDRFEVSQRDALTGKPSRTVKLPAGLRSAYLASADPLVVAAYVGDEDNPSDANRLLTFDTDGSLKATIEIGGYVPGCRSGSGCGAVAAAKDTVYLASRRADILSGNHIAAFDASTGQRRWTVDGLDGAEMLPLRTDDAGIIAYSDAGPGRDGSGVLHLAAADGQQKVLLTQPDGPEVSNATSQMASPGMREPIIYEDGRLFFHRTYGFFVAGGPLSYAFTTR